MKRAYTIFYAKKNGSIKLELEEITMYVFLQINYFFKRTR